MIEFKHGGAGVAVVDSEVEREQALQNGVCRDWNHVYASYLWNLTGKYAFQLLLVSVLNAI